MRDACACDVLTARSGRAVQVALACIAQTWWLACATPAQPQVALAAPAAVSGGEQLSAPGLSGAWAEYWAVKGGTDTQRYVFRDDGRFAWLAAAAAEPNALIQKQGTYAIEHTDNSQMLVLNVSRERFAACSERCSHHAEGPRTVEHATPLVERHELGECAPNLEAQALDEHYACRAIAGRAFWRSDAASESDLAGLFE